MTTKTDNTRAAAHVRQRATSPSPAPFHDLLKAWRGTRRFSQLELAARASLSQRHLSFLETGRSSPSRDMVLRLSRVLALPLRERNELLCAAGFAPVYAERRLDEAAMAGIRLALETTLAHHEPLPALVVNRQWDMVMHNAAVERLVRLLGEPSRVWRAVDPTGGRNIMRLMLHPRGLKPLVVDWPDMAASLLMRLQAEAQANPANAGLQVLLAELVDLPGVSAAAAADTPQRVDVPVLSLRLRIGQATLSFFSMICTFGTALDLTADELRLELLFPSDEASGAFLRQAAALSSKEPTR